MPGGAKFSLTLAPAKLAQGKPVTVWDTGATKLHIVTQAVEINRVHGVCKVTGLAPYAHVSPATITLLPDEHSKAIVRLAHIPAGKHDVGIEFSSVASHQGNIHVSGAVAAQMLVKGTGHVAHAVKPCVSLSAPHTSSFPTVLVAGTVLAIVLLAIGIVIAVKSHHPKGSHR